MHMGIARTALIAWLDARVHEGRFVLRIEDIDGPRVVEGSAASILRDLEWLGLDWDGPIEFQSSRSELYQRALADLETKGLVYPCTCSRKEIRAASAPHGPSDEGPRYPGTCRGGARPKPNRQAAYRFRTPKGRVIEQLDRRLGPIGQDVEASVGDFVLRRSDGLWAYQLAVTVDDYLQGVTCIVRGEDLAASTPRQLLLRGALYSDAPALETLHVPLVIGNDGRRLATRDGAAAVAETRADGARPAAVVGQLAATLGLASAGDERTPRELLEAWAERLEDSTSQPAG